MSQDGGKLRQDLKFSRVDDATGKTVWHFHYADRLLGSIEEVEGEFIASHTVDGVLQTRKFDSRSVAAIWLVKLAMAEDGRESEGSEDEP